ncbi:putative protein serine/threonine kinase [Cavenderia fasciculata]|uniref:BUB1 N-terminal domain-containing protein n=1 Tax=Cavenderia fasciculata TaxID=261658 RepID=F4Q3S0_CACFS|nr:putative protein serine/threonine kinase [Cavenderia fasciculata]EGG16886.1 putative protein serine/threonine kinase [Cavenderia fasciculata]|eukprot:XP_004355360.1 putative protein serine/threonine kinase [Cavenderia fasciculata]
MSVSDWENVKENILPLKTGRDPTKLAQQFTTPTKQVEEKLVKEKAEFEKAIQEYKGEDPLDLWTKYVKWIQQSYPGGNMKSELLVLLQRCNNLFVKSDQYKNDMRYLRLWLIYADMCREPIEIFNYLEVHGIGSQLSLLYEAKAIIYENKTNYPLADQSYQLGIQRRAQPLDRLQKKHTEFEKRLVHHMKNKDLLTASSSTSNQPASNVPPSTPNNNENTPTIQRAALGTISSTVVTSERKSSQIRGAPIGNGVSSTPSSSSAAAASGDLVKKRKTVESSASKKSSSSTVFGSGASNGFQVYDDSKGGSDDSSPIETNQKFVGKKSSSTSTSSSSSSNTMYSSGIKWEELEPEIGKHKENTMAPAKWNESKVVQKKIKTAPAGPAFEIFCDDTTSSEQQQPIAAAQGLLKNIVPIQTQVEQIQDNPLANFPKPDIASASSSSSSSSSTSTSSKTTKKSSSSSSSSSSTNAAATAAATTVSNEKIGYNKSLFMQGENELSFEEIRAKHYKAKQEQRKQQLQQKQQREESMMMMAEQNNNNNNNTSSVTMESSMIVSETSQRCPSPTMTINTKEALKDVMSWFHTPMQFEKKGKASKISSSTPSRLRSLSPTPFSEIENEDLDHLENQENIDPVNLNINQDLKKITNGDIVKKTLLGNDTTTLDIQKHIRQQQNQQDDSLDDEEYERGDTVHTRDRIDLLVKKEINKPSGGFSIFQDNNQSTTSAPVKQSFSIFQDNQETNNKPSASSGGFSIFQDEPTPTPAVVKSNTFAIYEDPKVISQPEITSPPSPLALAQNIKLSGEGIIPATSGGFAIYQDPEPSTTTSSSITTSSPTPSSSSSSSSSTSPCSSNLTSQLNTTMDKTQIIEICLTPSNGIVEPYNDVHRCMVDSHVIQYLALVDSFMDCSNQPMPTFEALESANGGMINLNDDLSLSISKCLSSDGSSTTGSKVYRAEASGDVVILQLAKPSNHWPFYIRQQISERIVESATTALMSMSGGDANVDEQQQAIAEAKVESSLSRFTSFYSAHLYNNASITLTELMEHGSLSSIIQRLSSDKKTLEEPLKMYYALDILSTLEMLHGCQIIHGGLSADHLYPAFSASGSDWTAQNGCPAGWLKLSSFKNCIDAKLYNKDEEQQVTFSCPTRDMLPSTLCTPLADILMDRKTWAYDLDYLGALQTIYQIVNDSVDLSGLSVTKTADDGKLKLDTSKLKPTLQLTVWNQVFDALLNCGGSGKCPFQSIKSIIEKYLEANPTKTKSIYRQIRKLKIDYQPSTLSNI